MGVAKDEPLRLLPFTNWSLLLNFSVTSVHESTKVGPDGPILVDRNVTSGGLPLATPSTFHPETGTCQVWQGAQHALFQLANLCAVVSLLTPCSFRHHILFMRSWLAVCYLLLVLWAGFFVCMLDALVWNCLFFFIDFMHIISLAYTNIPNQFSPSVNDFYKKRLRPLKVSRKEFGEMCNMGTIVSLHKGGFYSFENHTLAREKVSVLLHGRLRVTHEGLFLHSIVANEFIDSPEFDTQPLFSEDSSEKFQVTISASEDSMMLSWVYPILQAYFATNPFMYAIFTNLIGKDISDKLYKIQELLLKNPEEILCDFIPRNSSMVNVRRCLQSPEEQTSEFSEADLAVSDTILESSFDLNNVQVVNPGDETKI
ncbi:hypothetical protein BsWGS_28402 [Bradybaena similaris]